ncbi:hypothetical protein SNEBB_005917 [Seison nebaliae]|nr:hypothetical protein SNEBB_005917 [Seison nebaliae]
MYRIKRSLELINLQEGDKENEKRLDKLPRLGIARLPLIRVNNDGNETVPLQPNCNKIPVWSLVKETNVHESIIQSIITSEFRSPFLGNAPSNANRNIGLGLRRCIVNKRSLFDPNEENALIIYSPPIFTKEELLYINKEELEVHIVVDPIIGNKLRPHQREGVKFMYDAVEGLNIEHFHGCIMADEMGLGKTLQCITLISTLLTQGKNCQPTINKVVIITPSSLVKNWENEFKKWLGNQFRVESIDGGGKLGIESRLKNWIGQMGNRVCTPILIVSYETLRLHINAFVPDFEKSTKNSKKRIVTKEEVDEKKKEKKFDIGLMICDEGHRLKNRENQTYEALNSLPCNRRILISGTPIQNDLLEYYSLISFVNNGLLGDINEFRRRFELPIIRGRDIDANDDQKKKCEEKLSELLSIVSKSIIRRTQIFLTKYLPSKYEVIICSNLTPIQSALYQKLLEPILEKMDRSTSDTSDSTTSILKRLTIFKKLCNHPSLIINKKNNDNDDEIQQLLERIISPKLFNILSNDKLSVELSGKFMILDSLLALTKKETNDKFVLISNYTQTLDLFEQLARLRNYRYVRLDGSMSIKKRGKIVNDFNNEEPKKKEKIIKKENFSKRKKKKTVNNNDDNDDDDDDMKKDEIFLFLLSSKAGGCGLNLIGANRLVMFDPDWNPANDQQAMARIWRDGQKKNCFIYRFLATGTMEEKIFQRQTHKQALSSCVVDMKENVERQFSLNDLKEIFFFNPNTLSDTHEKLNCSRCVKSIENEAPPPTATCTDNLSQWHHCGQLNNLRELPDQMLKSVWHLPMTVGKRKHPISFIFHQKSHEQLKTV